jgi:hypothetical protein
MTFWLKMIGTSESHWPVGQPYNYGYIGFRGRKPSGVHPGDRMILYAVGSKRLFGVVDGIRAMTTGGLIAWIFAPQ